MGNDGRVAGGIASPVFVGRRAELTLLLAGLERAAGGEPAVVLVGGEAGVGKTRLVEEVAARADARGGRVLAGACVELGGDRLPLAPLADALRALARSTSDADLAAVLGPARRELARLLPELDREAAFAAGEAPRTSQLVELVLGVVERLAAERPLMLVLEDLHWADGATLELMAFLVRALRGVGVLLVGTYRSDELHRGHPLRPLLSGWDRVRTVQRIELGRFARDEVTAQLEAILDERPTAELLDLVLERSEGNAFLVEEIAGAVRGGADPGYLPPSLRDMLLVRAEQLSDGAQRVLRTVAVAGRWVPDRLLAAVTPLDETALYAALRETVDHHLLVVDETGRGYAFRHALAREAVYDDMLPGERVRLHTAYGEALVERPELAADAGGAAALAYHWYAAHDLPRAMTASIDAARAASAAYAPAEALRHLERALELWPQVPDAVARAGIDRAEALRLAAQAANAAGELERALTLLDAALGEPEASDAQRRALLLERRSLTLLALGRSDEAIPDLETALATLPPDPPSLTRAVVLAKLAAVHLQAAALDAATAAAEAAVEAARAVGAREEEADAQITLGTALANVGDGEAGLERLRAGLAVALEAGDHETALRGHVNLSDALGMQARYGEAAEVARDGIALAERVGRARTFGAYLGGNLIEPTIRLGRWAEAGALLDDLLSRPLEGIFAAWLHELRAELAAHTGEFARVDAELRRIRALVAADAAQYADVLAYIEAETARARGEPEAGRAIVAEALAAESALANRYAWPLVWLGLRIDADALQAARRRGEPEEQEIRARAAALARFAEGLPAVTARAAGCRALVAPEAARAAAEPAEWAAAVASWRRLGEPYMLAYALMRDAEASAEAGDRGRAAAAAGEALVHLRALGAQPLLDELLAISRRARLAVEGTPAGDAAQDGPLAGYGLTDRELEVLRLVAEGRSNSQIGAELFITRKTASVHVSNILAKLGVSSRGEAAAVLNRHRP
jgi:DNA-binding CsgD family transcriptional regulator